MGFSLVQTTTTWAGEDRSWTKHRKGYDTCRSITLDLALFIPATHAPNGYLPSGLVIAKLTATGRYGYYSDAATAGVGTDAAAGHLFSAVYIGTATTGRVAAALFWEGIVNVPRLPSNSGITTASKLDLANSIRYEAAGD